MEENKTKFTFRNKEYILEDLLEDGDLFDLEGPDGSAQGKIIVRAGIGRLSDKLENIDWHIGPIQQFEFNDVKGMAIECACIDLEDKDGPCGRSFGEASPSNCIGIGSNYPVSMAEKRGKARSLLDLLGIRGVYSEDEAKELKDQVTKQSNRKSSKKEAKEDTISDKSIVKKINQYVDDLGIGKEGKLNIYRDILGDKTLTLSEIKTQATEDTKKEVLSRLKEKSESSN